MKKAIFGFFTLIIIQSVSANSETTIALESDSATVEANGFPVVELASPKKARTASICNSNLDLNDVGRLVSLSDSKPDQATQRKTLDNDGLPAWLQE
jgi:hypothetical protein